MRQSLQSALDEARTLAPAELPRLLGELEEIRATALARLTAPAAPERPDELIEVSEAANRLGVSPDYVYHHSVQWSFTRRQGRKLLFSAKGIEDYIKRKSSVTPRRHTAMLPSDR